MHQGTQTRPSDLLLAVVRIKESDDIPGLAVEFKSPSTAPEREIILAPYTQWTVTAIEPRRFFWFYDEAKMSFFRRPGRSYAFRIVYFDVERDRPATRALATLEHEWKAVVEQKDVLPTKRFELATTALEHARKALEKPLWRNPAEADVRTTLAKVLLCCQSRLMWISREFKNTRNASRNDSKLLVGDAPEAHRKRDSCE